MVSWLVGIRELCGDSNVFYDGKKEHRISGTYNLKGFEPSVKSIMNNVH